MSQFFDVEPLPGYRPDVGLLLASLNDSTREWRDELGDPPLEAITWQAKPGSYSVGGLLLHIMEVEVYWFETVAAALEENVEESKLLMSAEIQQYEGLWPTPPAKPLSWYYDLHDKIRARVFESLKSVDPDSRYDRGDFSFTFRWILAHVVEHDAYHGGQAVLMHELWKKR